MINEFKYGQTSKICPSPLSLSLYSTFKLYEKILYGRLREVVDIKKFSMGLCRGNGLLILCLF